MGTLIVGTAGFTAVMGVGTAVATLIDRWKARRA